MGKAGWAVAVILGGYLSSLSCAAPYGGGSGTPEDPYQIWTPEQMNTIGANSADWSKHFKLMADIDMAAYTGTQYNIIGSIVNRFSGTFDGNCHVITNLTYSTTAFGDLGNGLLGCNSGTIKNLGLVNVSISAIHTRVGGLAGQNYGTIISCYSSGYVNGTAGTGQYFGGLVGVNCGTIRNCYSACCINGNLGVGGIAGFNLNLIIECRALGSISGYSCVGGIAGDNNLASIISCDALGSVNGQYVTGGLCGRNAGTVTNSWSGGTVTGTGYNIGGLCGRLDNGTISQCYATGAVSGGSEVGGLVGWNGNGKIIHSYSTGKPTGNSSVGGLCGGIYVGENYEDRNNCWDINTSGTTSSIMGVGKASAQMMMAATYMAGGWDFSYTDGDEADWRMLREGEDYPILAWQKVYAGDIAGRYGVDLEDWAEVSRNWLEDGCPLDCEQADIDASGQVNLTDFWILAEQWFDARLGAPLTPMPMPAAWWKMDSRVGIVVPDSVSTHQGKAIGITDSSWVPGHIDYALAFDGISSFVGIFDGYKGVCGTASRSCSAWVKSNANGKLQMILSWGANVRGQKWMLALRPDGTLALGVWTDYVQTASSIADGQWHHVAVVLQNDGTPTVDEIKLYVDGIAQIVTFTTAQAIDTVAGQDVLIGSANLGSGQSSFFNGFIDDVRIYNTALMEAEILRLSNE